MRRNKARKRQFSNTFKYQDKKVPLKRGGRRVY